MDYNSILVLTDFSLDSQEAVRAAADFSGKYDAALTVLHVMPDQTSLSFVMSDSEYHSLEKRIIQHTDESFEELERQVPELAAVAHSKLTAKGIPYISCLEEIESGKYDVVFIGSHGTSNLRHMFMGSTAHKVLRRSPISVFVIRRKT